MHLVAKIGSDTAENGPSEICSKSSFVVLENAEKLEGGDPKWQCKWHKRTEKRTAGTTT